MKFLLYFWAVSLLAANPDKLVKIYQEDFPKKTYFRKVRRAPLDIIHSLSTLSKSNQSKLCKVLKDQWPEYIKELKTMRVNTSLVKSSLIVTLGGIGETCPNRELLDKLIDLNYNVPRAFSHLRGRELWGLIPHRSTGLTYNARGFVGSYDAYKFLQYLNPMIEGIKCDEELINRPPKKDECWGMWLFKQLQDYSQFQKRKISKDAQGYSENNLPINFKQWSKFYSFAIKDSLKAQNWFFKLISKEKRRYLTYNFAQSMENMIFSSHWKISCEQAKAFAKEVFRDYPESVSAYTEGFISKVVMKSCEDITFLEKVFPSRGVHEVLITHFRGASLGDFQEHSVEDDLRLRKQLGLFFHYGAQFDIEDIKKAPLFNTAVDSILAEYIRRSSDTPWVRMIDNIEDHEERRNRLETLLMFLEKDRRPLFALVQQFYFENFKLGKSEDFDHVVKIRRLSTNIRVDSPKFGPLAFSLHNNLHKGLIKNVEVFYDQLDRNEKLKIEKKIKELLTLLQQFFAGSGTEELEKQWIGDRGEQFFHLWHRYIKNKSLDKILEMKTFFQKPFGKKDITFALQARKLIHNELMKILAPYKDGSLVEKSQGFQDLMRALYGIPETWTLEKITEEFKKLFIPRKNRFDLYLKIQSRRKVDRKDYLQSLLERKFALSFAYELLLREANLHLYSRFVKVDKHFKAMNPGIGIGKLVFVAGGELGRHAYSEQEILITDALPLNLGVTAGLITEIAQPLASHVDLRTKERGTPNVFFADARKKYAHLLGKIVFFEVKSGKLTLRLATEEEKKKVKVFRRNLKIPFANFENSKIAFVTGESLLKDVGAKSFGYGLLRKAFVGRWTPPALSIPFHYYGKFIKETGLDGEIGLLLSKNLQGKELEKALKDLRNQFKTKIKKWNDPLWNILSDKLGELRSQTLKEKLADDWDGKSFRFRSSTNSEDLVDFTGAGLYTSKTGRINDEKKTFRKAIGRVWASLWNFRAYSERELYGIEHNKVAMSVLVHRNFPNEDANGVLLTRSDLDKIHYISVLNGEESITNSTGGTADEYQVYRNFKTLIYYSKKLRGDKAVLSDLEVRELLMAGERALRMFQKNFKLNEKRVVMRLDMEFKIENSLGGRKLYIKQGRPFFP